MANQIVFIRASDLSVYEENPRLIMKDEFEELVRNINEDINFFHSRPCLVNRKNGQMIIYAGVQRFRASLHIGISEIPCFVEDDLQDDIMRKRCLLDNWHAGKWDYDIIANSWDAKELLSVGESLLKELNFPDLDSVKEPTKGKFSFKIDFDTKEQKEVFEHFINLIDSEYEGVNIGEKLIIFINGRN